MGYLPGVFEIAFILNPFVGPFLAAFIMTRITEGKAGVLRLRRRWFRRAPAGSGTCSSCLAFRRCSCWGFSFLPACWRASKVFRPTFLVTYLINFVIIFFLGGPLGEEPGWRGFALPRMQPRFGPLGGNPAPGCRVGLLASAGLPDSAQGGGPGTTFASFLTNLPIFFLMVMAITVIFTWVFNHTRGSVFIAILLHASINTQEVVAPFFQSTNLSSRATIDLAMLIAMVVPALLVISS